jgi:hypothetical protein
MEGLLVFLFGTFLAFVTGIINGALRQNCNRSLVIGIINVGGGILAFVICGFFGFLGSEFVFNDDLYKGIGVLFMFTGFLCLLFGFGTIASSTIKLLINQNNNRKLLG